MSRTKSFALLLILTFLFTAFSDKKAKVLIIGDSISIGYTPYVKEYLQEKAIVEHNPGNAEHTGTGLKKIREWLGNEKWDIIQFNWGLWDLCYRDPNSKIQGFRDKINGKLTFSVEEYSANLDSLVTILQQISNAKLVFVTTTYVPENEAGRIQEDPIRYNDAAKKIMKKHSIAVNDIYDRSMAIHNKFGKGTDDVHYTNDGYAELGRVVSDFLEIEINTLNGR